MCEEFPRKAEWISLREHRWPKKESPVPFVYQKKLDLCRRVKKARIKCTAMGIYELEIDGQKVGEDYFAPGFTSYKHQIQVQDYDVTEVLKENSLLQITVAGGWAVGSFNYNRKNRIAADRPSLLLELSVEYEDGSDEVIGTGTDWQVTIDGPVRMADWYDGETFDGSHSPESAKWLPAEIVRLRKEPKLLSQYGPLVRVWNTLSPISVTQAKSNEWIYDFGQNFAGVIFAKLQGKQGQIVVFRHAEVLSDNELFTANLRTAKATITYICRDGEQIYSPRFTYMGFRYVGVTGIQPEDLELKALALCSEMEQTGFFECSDARLNRLNENILWSARSNFVDIPTDCPQRDERLGWTGDIALFASTACFDFDMSGFLDKWLRDVSAEQNRFGGIPLVVPRNGLEWPPFTTAAWGDCCILVPWAEYMARGDMTLLARQYPVMKRFLGSVKRWASLFSFGHYRYIWKLLFQFGDWCAPGEGIRQWMSKGKWIATAYFANSCGIVAQVAELLDKPEEARCYRKLREKIIHAYRKVFTDGKGTLLKPFQTAYVLPLYFGMTEGDETAQMAKNLDTLVEQAGNKLTTGFTGTPYLLFALSDNGYADRAYSLLLQEACPSWLYEVKVGATTIWERWDGIRADGTLSDDPMMSFNHYAYGAVGDWLYRRVVGIEAISGGYKSFRIAPITGGGLTWAKGKIKTTHGEIVSDWKIENNIFTIDVTVPEGTMCSLVMPGGETYTLEKGNHKYSKTITKREEPV